MKRLMLFIEPAGAQLNIFTQFTLPRLGSFILAGLVNRRDGWSARVFVEGRQRFGLQAWIAEHGRPEVVGISTITATVQRGYALADECRARGIPVVLGRTACHFPARRGAGSWGPCRTRRRRRGDGSAAGPLA